MADYLTLTGTIQKKRTGLSSGVDQYLTNFPISLSAAAGVGIPGQQITLAASATWTFASATLTMMAPVITALGVYIYGDDPRLDLYLAAGGTKIPVRNFFYSQLSANPTQVRFYNPTTVPILFDLWLVGTTV